MSELSLKEKLSLKKSEGTSKTIKSTTKTSKKSEGIVGHFFVFITSIVSLVTGLILFFYY